MLNEDPIFKLEASLERFPCKLKQKRFFNENEYDKLYPSGFALAHIFSAPKMHMFSSSDTFPKLCLLLLVFLIIILSGSYVIFFHSYFLMITLAKVHFCYIKDTFFFIGIFYNQINGVAMASPLVLSMLIF